MRSRIGLVLLALVAALLAASGIAKLAGVDKVVAELQAFGFDTRSVLLIAVAEIAGAILLVLPRTHSLGLLIVSAFLGGAIATHLQHGQSILPPAVPLAIAWIATSLRRPQLLWGQLT